MKILKNLNSFEYVNCLVEDSFFNKSLDKCDDKMMRKYNVSIVYDGEEEQFYCVDNKTHLILNTHLTVSDCINWFYRIGFEIIELKRTYDKKVYNKELQHYKDFINFLQAGEYTGVIL